MASIADDDEFGGIPIGESNKPDESFLCKKCLQLLLFPTQLPCCGERLCNCCAIHGTITEETKKCPYCSELLHKSEIARDRGAERDLKSSTFSCYACSWTGKYEPYKEHLKLEHANFECPHCHNRFYAKNLRFEHMKEECLEYVIPCELNACAQSIKRKDLEEHYKSEDHQLLLNKLLLESGDESIRRYFPEYYQETLTERDKEAKTFQDILPEFESIVENLHEDQIEINQNVSQIKEGFEKLLTGTDDNKQMALKFKDCKKLIDAATENLKQMKQTANQKTDQLLDDRATVILRFDSIDSPPIQFFKTSSFGIKFSVRLCRTPDKSNSSIQYLSVYLRILPSEFDSIIQFPFAHDIYIVLFNQVRGKNKIRKCLVAPQSPALARPQPPHENPEFGIIDFCTIAEFIDQQNQYLIDGVFFIGIYIDYLKDWVKSSSNENSDDLDSIAKRFLQF